MGLTLREGVVIEVGDIISQATLRTDDLVTSFMDFIEATCDDESIKAVASEYVECKLLEDDNDSDELAWFLNEFLFDCMNEIAPEGTYFGSHPGDGSLFGFWEIEEVDED